DVGAKGEGPGDTGVNGEGGRLTLDRVVSDVPNLSRGEVDPGAGVPNWTVLPPGLSSTAGLPSTVLPSLEGVGSLFFLVVMASRFSVFALARRSPGPACFASSNGVGWALGWAFQVTRPGAP